MDSIVPNAPAYDECSQHRLYPTLRILFPHNTGAIAQEDLIHPLTRSSANWSAPPAASWRGRRTWMHCDEAPPLSIAVLARGSGGFACPQPGSVEGIGHPVAPIPPDREHTITAAGGADVQRYRLSARNRASLVSSSRRESECLVGARRIRSTPDSRHRADIQ